MRQEEGTERCQVSMLLEPTGYLPFAGSPWQSLATSPLRGDLSLAPATPLLLFPSLKIPVSVSPGTLKKQHKNNSSTKKTQSFYNNNQQKSFSSHCSGCPGFGFSKTKESFHTTTPLPQENSCLTQKKIQTYTLKKTGY